MTDIKPGDEVVALSDDFVSSFSVVKGRIYVCEGFGNCEGLDSCPCCGDDSPLYIIIAGQKAEDYQLCPCTFRKINRVNDAFLARLLEPADLGVDETAETP